MTVRSALTRLTEIEFDKILEARAVRCAYQPIVWLDNDEVVGYEALARGAPDAHWTNPTELFDVATRAGRLPELDWICRAAACRGAMTAEMPREVPLFVNVEPTTSRTRSPRDLVDTFYQATEQLQIVAEITERSLTSDPAGLLATVAELRQFGNRVALDDVGAFPGTQSMMSILRPDVIKLDREIIQGPTTSSVLSIVEAVAAEAERTGAVVLAEGIETREHHATARSLGATLGQGWLFGRPGPLPPRFVASSFRLPRVDRPQITAETPFDVVRHHRTPARVSKHLLVPLSRQIENRGVHGSESSVLLATFQDGRYYGEGIRRRYGRLAERGALTAVYARDLPVDLGSHVRGCDLSDEDPLVDEWNVIVIGSHFTGGLFARECDTDYDTDGERMFDLVVSYDRELILAAAEPLLRRILPERLPLPTT